MSEIRIYCTCGKGKTILIEGEISGKTVYITLKCSNCGAEETIRLGDHK